MTDTPSTPFELSPVQTLFTGRSTADEVEGYDTRSVYASLNSEPVQALRALSGQYPVWGFWKLHHRLRKNGLVINHKHTLRIYRALALNLPRHLKKRVPARVKQPLAVPEANNKCWSLDFTSNVLTDGRRFRTLNVLDDYNRELLGVEIVFSLPASRVVQVLTRLVEYHGCPAQLRTDNGPECISTIE